LWQTCLHVCAPQLRTFPQTSPQDLPESFSPQRRRYEERPQKQNFGGPIAEHGGHGPGWQMLRTSQKSC
jgi:hypothetical protein